MALEIEKKYLLKNFPSMCDIDERNTSFYIQQYYTDDGTRYRLTTANTPISGEDSKVYTKTIKHFISAGVCEEIESVISYEEFYEAMEVVTSYICKTRCIKYMHGRKWEIDQYDDIILIIAECELDKVEDLNTLIVPKGIKDQIIMDVTHLKEFSNRSLAITIEKDLYL